MKNHIRFLPPVILLFFLLLFSSCETKVDSVGEDDEIIVFADSLDWINYKEPMNSVFGNYIKTPVLERDYLLKWEPFEHFEHYKKFKNIFILGRLNSNQPVSQNVRSLLNDDIIAGVKSGNYFYIPKKDAWAMHQYVLFLVANSEEDMVQKIVDYGDLMYKDFQSYYFTRLKAEMFKRMEQKELEKYIANHFPFTIRVQHDYFIADENLEDGYVWIRRLHPDRSILVHWQTVSPEFKLSTGWVVQERNRLAKEVYEGDVVVEEETRAKFIRFKEWNAVKLEGVWKNEKYMIGGPFHNITFIDRNLNRLYFIDGYVQAIGRRKKPFLDQLEVIMHTFDVQKMPKLPEGE